jgi:hypothetical protein
VGFPAAPRITRRVTRFSFAGNAFAQQKGSGKSSISISDPAKPGFADGKYVLEIESAGSSTGNLVNDDTAAAYFITLTVSGQKCTLHNLASVDPNAPDATCRTGMNPACALPEGVGKCSANIYQVAGSQLEAAGPVANQPFSARFRIRTNDDPSNCKTGHLVLEAAGLAPPTKTWPGRHRRRCRWRRARHPGGAVID